MIYGNGQNELSPDGNEGRYFSVDICLTSKGRVLEKPQTATSFIEAVQIAYKEAVRLKWVDEINDHTQTIQPLVIIGGHKYSVELDETLSPGGWYLKRVENDRNNLNN